MDTLASLRGRRPGVARVRRAGGSLVVASLGSYAALKLVWLAAVVTDGVPPGWRAVDWVVLNAVTIGLAAGGVLVGLVVARPWGLRVPAPVVLVPAWLGCGFLVTLLPFLAASSVWEAVASPAPDPSGGSALQLPGWEAVVLTASFAGAGIGLAVGLPAYLVQRWPGALRPRPAALTPVGRRLAPLVALTAGAPAALQLGVVCGLVGDAPVRDRLLAGSFAAWALVTAWAVLGLARGCLRGRGAWAALVLGSGSLVAWGAWRTALTLWRPAGTGATTPGAVEVLEPLLGLVAGLGAAALAVACWSFHGRVERLVPGRARGVEGAALLGSAVLVLAGLVLLAEPSAFPFGPDDRYRDMSLVAGVRPETAAVVLVATGGASALLLGAARGRDRTPAWAQWLLVVVAGVMAVLYGYVVPDISLLILTAYSLTLALPALLVLLLVLRRESRRRPVDGRTLLRRAVPVGLGTLVLGLALFLLLGRPWEWAAGSDGRTTWHRPVVLVGSLLVGVAWAGVAVRAFRTVRGSCARCGRPGPSWSAPEAAARWGRVVTWAAALTPLPYVVARLTWLTPWPYGESTEHLAAHPGLWVFGLGLAVAGEVGTWLTLGLVERRGEVFPRWVPVRGGQPVPPMAAVVPGLAVALLMSVGGHSVVQQAFGPGTTVADHLLVLFVPLPVWGPLLALGTLAYWYRRRGPCRLHADPAPVVATSEEETSHDRTCDRPAAPARPSPMGGPGRVGGAAVHPSVRAVAARPGDGPVRG